MLVTKYKQYYKLYMKNGVLSFHQGWSDVINCLPLINYYARLYNNLTVISRSDKSNILEYYIKDKPNVTIHYTPTDDTDSIAIELSKDPTLDMLLHGFHDENRQDQYKKVFVQKYFSVKPDIGILGIHFVKLFYELYDIPYITRIEDFNFTRDLNLEEKAYSSFLDECSTPYIVSHNGQKHEYVDFNLSNNLYNLNLNGRFKNIFSSIKILENASEIHLIDSIWAAFCYMLDCKFGIFKNIPIKLYPYKTRSGACIANPHVTKLEPLHPSNWTVIQQ